MFHSASSSRSFFTGRLSVLLLTLIVLIFVGSASAQVLTGTLTGTVTDTTDAVVPNAAVTVTSLTNGQVYKEKTDAAGIFVVNALPNGFYKIEVEFPGFAKTEIERVEIFVSQTSRANLKLQVARTGTEVVVEAQQTTLQSDSAELKGSVEAVQLDVIPLPTRNPLDLVKMFAGVLTPPTT